MARDDDATAEARIEPTTDSVPCGQVAPAAGHDTIPTRGDGDGRTTDDRAEFSTRGECGNTASRVLRVRGVLVYFCRHHKRQALNEARERLGTPISVTSESGGRLRPGAEPESDGYDVQKTIKQLEAQGDGRMECPECGHPVVPSGDGRMQCPTHGIVRESGEAGQSVGQHARGG